MGGPDAVPLQSLIEKSTQVLNTDLMRSNLIVPVGITDDRLHSLDMPLLCLPRAIETFSDQPDRVSDGLTEMRGTSGYHRALPTYELATPRR